MIKTFQFRLRTGKEKPKVYDKRGNLFKERSSQNKVLFGSQRGQTTNCQTATIGFLTLSVPKR